MPTLLNFIVLVFLLYAGCTILLVLGYAFGGEAGLLLAAGAITLATCTLLLAES